MENKKNQMCANFAKKVVSNIGKHNNNLVIIKHYGTFGISQEDAKNAMIAHPNVNTYYHHFENSDMVETYEPFLNIIKNFYLKYYYNVTIDEFLGEFDIYKLQKSFFKSYIESGSCLRTEPFILDEIEFERTKMNESVANIIISLSKIHPMLILINNLHMAPKSTIALLQNLSTREENKNIGIIVAYNDLKDELPCVADLWNKYIDQMNMLGCVYEGGAYQVAENEDSASFVFESKKSYEYLIKLTAMYYALDFETAEFYLLKIYNKLESEKINIDINCKIKIYRLYALISTFSNDISNAQLLCDNLKEICEQYPSLEAEYKYNEILTYTHIYSGKLEKAKKNALRCMDIAKKQKSDKYIFNAEMLLIMLEMSGWHNVYFFNKDTEVSDEFIEKAQKYGFYNHLAYIYIFSKGNLPETFKNIKRSVELDEKLTVYMEGIDLARNLGNTFLVIKGYKKNIMLCSTHGLFNEAKYYYSKCKDIMGDTTEPGFAEIRNGLGYINCTTHNYVKANKNYNQALDYYMKHGMVDAVGETLYNMATNCILANEMQKAYNYLLTCVRIIKTLRLNDLRVCNIAKIFGLLALCSARLSLEYNCILYLDTCRRFLSVYLNGNNYNEDNIRIDKSYVGNDDELFLFYFVNGLRSIQSGKYKYALSYLLKAEEHCRLSPGNMFFAFIQLKLEIAKTYKNLNNAEEAAKQYDEAYAYAKKNKYTKEMEMIEKLKNGEEYIAEVVDLPLTGYTIENFNEITRQAGILKRYEEAKDNMQFISMWQNVLEINNKTKNELIATASNSFMLNFGLDAFIYIKFNGDKATVVLNTDDKQLDDASLEYLRTYFEKNRSGFVTSKLKKNHNDYNKILSIFGLDYICSMVCNPFFANEKLDSLFISFIYIKNNWNEQNSNYLLDESELNIFNLLLKQLLNAIDKIEKINEIRHINNELRKSSITDYLTGLNNRDGFYKKVNKLIDAAVASESSFRMAILYIDLDNFKYYNDTFGHDVGDLILKEISVLLQEAAGSEGFATRYGGDEFLITLINCDKETAYVTAKMTLDTILSKNGYVSQISDFMEKQVVIPREKSVSCSIGVAFSNNVNSERDLSELIKNADSALYDIKNTTKNAVKLYEE